MSPKLPSLTAEETAKLAEKAGFIKVSQKGSYVKYRHPDGRVTIIPLHKGETIGTGLLLKILNDIGIDIHKIRHGL